MRSACWGARSVRSLKTMRPLVVSITIAFCLSRFAGSGCAIAGTAQISAATNAKIRIMKTPDARNRLAGELGLEAGRNQWRHECRHVAAHGRDLTHQCGGCRDRPPPGRDKSQLAAQ